MSTLLLQTLPVLIMVFSSLRFCNFFLTIFTIYMWHFQGEIWEKMSWYWFCFQLEQFTGSSNVNNKENTASILLSIIFWSHFIVFDFTMKSLLIIMFYFHWRMLAFELSSPAPLNKKNKSPKERGISNKSTNYVVNVSFQIIYNVWKQKFENKNCGSFYIFLVYVLILWYYSSPRVKEIFRLNIFR